MQTIKPQINIKRGDVWSGYFEFNEVEDYVIEPLSDRGYHDASGNTYPAAGGSGTAGAIIAGDIWTVSTGGTLNSESVVAGDKLLALVDTPGSTNANWQIVSVDPIDVTTDDWIMTFEANGVTKFTASTANGYITTSNTNRVNYSIPAVVTEQLTAEAVYGELKNTTTNTTMLGIETVVEDSPNV